MMQEKIGRELERYGRTVTLYTPQHPEGVAVKAVVQWERNRGAAKAVPSPLGWKKQGRLLYLGPADVRLDGAGIRLEVDGVCYDGRNARAVYAGKELTHWWAVFEEVR